MTTKKESRAQGPSPIANVTKAVGGAVTRMVEQVNHVVDNAITVLPGPVRGVAEGGLSRGRELASGANRRAAAVRAEVMKATDTVLTEKGRRTLVARVERQARGTVQQTLSSVFGTPTRSQVTTLRRRLDELEERIETIAGGNAGVEDAKADRARSGLT